MADDSYLGQVLGWLKGAETPNTTANLAPPLTSYPSNEDARMARGYGFSQGSVNQPYLDNDSAHILGSNFQPSNFAPGTVTTLDKNMKNFFLPDSAEGRKLSYVGGAINDPKASSLVDLKDPNNTTLRGATEDHFMRAGLAANRSPIAAVGFDPTRTVVDTLMKNPNVEGVYAHQPDGIYSVLTPDDSIVHESTHRGFQKLREQYPDQVNSAFTHLPSEETTVRWLMHSLGGDPEGGSGPVDAKQRQHGIDYFTGPQGDAAKKALDQIQELAIGVMKGRGKRAGPQ